MKFLVEAGPSIEKAEEILAKGGPAPILSYINERFKTEATYLDATRRKAFFVVNLPAESDVLELGLYCLSAWGTEAKFTPLASPDTLTSVLSKVSKAPGIR